VKDAFENFEFDRIARHEAQCNGLAGDVARQADAMNYPSGGLRTCLRILVVLAHRQNFFIAARIPLTLY
jgi:hypothetical protein